MIRLCERTREWMVLPNIKISGMDLLGVAETRAYDTPTLS